MPVSREFEDTYRAAEHESESARSSAESLTARLVKELVCTKAGVDEALRTVDWGGNTLLHRLAAHGCREACMVLLDSGAGDPRRQNGTKKTPVELAFRNGHLSTAMALQNPPGDVLRGGCSTAEGSVNSSNEGSIGAAVETVGDGPCHVSNIRGRRRGHIGGGAVIASVSETRKERRPTDQSVSASNIHSQPKCRNIGSDTQPQEQRREYQDRRGSADDGRETVSKVVTDGNPEDVGESGDSDSDSDQ